MTTFGLDDLFSLRVIGNAVISPDGSQVVFAEAEFDLEADDAAWSLFVLPTDGSAPPRRLTDGRRDGKPAWSPDGTQVAFLAARAVAWRQDLQVVDVATGDVRTAAALPRGIGAFAWSPTGDGFALVGGPEYPDDPRRPTDDPAVRRARYAERVMRIDHFQYRASGVFLDTEPAQLWWCPAGGEPVMVTDGTAAVTLPGFLPDGRLTFSSDRAARPDLREDGQVWAVGRDGSELEAVTDVVSALRGYAIGATGTVAVIGIDVPAFAYGSHPTHLWVDGKDWTPPLDGMIGRKTELQSLTVDYLTSTSSPQIDDAGEVWSTVVERGRCEVRRFRDGVSTVIVGGDRMVGDFSLGGGRLAFTATDATRPVALYVCDAKDGAGERLLYDPNPWLADREVGELRHFDVTIDTGEHMDAWVALPAGHDGSPLRTILDIHPGPHSSYGYDFRLDHRLLAAAGFAVISCNFPGSQGYGMDWARRTDGHWGEADLPAHLAMLDEAVRLGFTDGDRVGVGGITYGAFSALWLAAHTDRFKAVVTNRAISDLTVEWAQMDLGPTFYKASIGAQPWEDPELYRRLSPSTYVEQITAPTRLLAFGGNGRTPVTASELIFLRLLDMGRTTDLMVFPAGAGTVLMPGRPWSKQALIEATVDWFAAYL